MYYNANSLGFLIRSYSESSSVLTPSGSLTDAYTSMCYALASAISDTHNSFQSSASANNIIVNGGTCSVGGPLSGGIGIGVPGFITGSLSGVSNACVSEFPTSSMYDITLALRSFVSSIGQGFETVYNSFLSSASISNISVNGGTCTCQIIMGAPVPGSYSGGVGQLSTLSGSVTDTMSAGSLYSTMLGLMDSNVLAQGSPTEYLSDSLNAICYALIDYHQQWMQGTQIDNLQVSGGVTIPFGPIAGAVGVSGALI